MNRKPRQQKPSTFNHKGAGGLSSCPFFVVLNRTKLSCLTRYRPGGFYPLCFFRFRGDTMRKQQTDLRPSLREICILIFGVIIPLENRKPNTAQKRCIEKMPYGETFLKCFKPQRGNWDRPPIVTINEKKHTGWIKLIVNRYSLSVKNHSPKRPKYKKVNRAVFLRCSPILSSTILFIPPQRGNETHIDYEMRVRTAKNKISRLRQVEEEMNRCGSVYLSFRDCERFYLKYPPSEYNKLVSQAHRALKEYWRLRRVSDKILESK